MNIHDLSINERITLVQNLWDSLANNPQDIPLTDAQTKILEQRRYAYKNDPYARESWASVKQRITAH
jgi:putative addiction module component (TIGR02574 family)